MKDRLNFRIRILWLIGAVVIFIITLMNTGSSLGSLLDSLIKSISHQCSFFKLMFKGNVLYTPSGQERFKYFLAFFLMVVPGIYILYSNHFLKMKKFNLVYLLPVYILMLAGFLYFNGLLLTRNLFEIDPPQYWIMKKSVLPNAPGNFQDFLKYLKYLGTGLFKFKDWFLFNIVILGLGIYRSLFPLKTPRPVTFVVSGIIEVFRIFIIFSLIKYVSLMMTLTLEI